MLICSAARGEPPRSIPAGAEAGVNASPSLRLRRRTGPACAGKRVYDANCAVCHNSAKETVQGVGVLRSPEAERIPAALVREGLMRDQGARLSPEQKANVIAFLIASRQTCIQIVEEPA